MVKCVSMFEILRCKKNTKKEKKKKILHEEEITFPSSILMMLIRMNLQRTLHHHNHQHHTLNNFNCVASGGAKSLWPSSSMWTMNLPRPQQQQRQLLLSSNSFIRVLAKIIFSFYLILILINGHCYCLIPNSDSSLEISESINNNNNNNNDYDTDAITANTGNGNNADVLKNSFQGDDQDDGDDNIEVGNGKPHQSGQWSVWSPWSPCSRICDGGISTSVRQCLSHKMACIGQHRRNKLCNMQPCMVKTDFRQIQCSSFNNKPYRDRYYEWLAFIDPTDPCSLTCKAKGLNFVAKLAPIITDGTRCRPGSLDVCVGGKCMTVGCDLKLGSLKKIDDCGVCGGDGTSCKNHSYSWGHRFYSNCSKTCGGGFQTSTVVCFDEMTNMVVDDIFCYSKYNKINSRQQQPQREEKPKPLTNGCNEFDCKPNWVAEKWSPCSRKCGIGIQTRKVYCILDLGNQLKTKIDDEQCSGYGRMKKPDMERKCNIEECPQWYEGPWSKCSETCGNGIQHRTVLCKDNKGSPSNECDALLRPLDRRNCSDISNCLQNNKSNSQEDAPDEEDPELLAKLYSEPNYDIGPWSPCNVSCGMGYKKRWVECQIYLEFSKTFAKIPLEECSHPVPVEYEICFGTDCDGKSKSSSSSSSNSTSDLIEINSFLEKYNWEITGFTICSANCLGGTQESMIECVRTRDGKKMPPMYCDDQPKPESYTKICNDQPCVPRWNVTEFGDCSKKCGAGGLRTRIVLCVHEIARGYNNLVVVPDDECPLPKPGSEEKCNQIDCPAKWIVEPWQKCSKDCGGGIKKRNIFCVKDFVFGGLQNVSNLDCSIRKPKLTKQCNMKPCQSSSSLSNTLVGNTEQNFRKSKRNHHGSIRSSRGGGGGHGKHIYNVQGMLSIYEGTSRLKLLCPDWDPSSSSSSMTIIWLKGHDRIVPNKKFSMADNILKIKNISLIDTGVYKCVQNSTIQATNTIEHSMFLHVLPRKDVNILNDQSISDPNSAIAAAATSASGAATTTNNNKFDSTNLYYQNELDVSEEMERYYSATTSAKKKSIKHFGKVKLKDENYMKRKRKNQDNNGSSSSGNGGRNSHGGGASGGIYELISEFKKRNKKLNLDNQEKQEEEEEEAEEKEVYGRVVHKKSDSYWNRKMVDNPSDDVNDPSSSTSLINQYEWITTDWSNCTIECGGFGFKIRYSQCFTRNGNMTSIVDDSYCLKQGLRKPKSFETCGLENCFYWNIGQWSECQGCIDIRKGIKTRKVNCLDRRRRRKSGKQQEEQRNDNQLADDVGTANIVDDDNNDNYDGNKETIVDDAICFQWQDKPLDKEECFNEQCLPLLQQKQPQLPQIQSIKQQQQQQSDQSKNCQQHDMDDKNSNDDNNNVDIFDEDRKCMSTMENDRRLQASPPSPPPPLLSSSTPPTITTTKSSNADTATTTTTTVSVADPKCVWKLTQQQQQQQPVDDDSLSCEEEK